jgi:hypothetical protein
VSARKQHEIWIEQCGAAETIKARYGLKAAFDYVVGEKLINFASAATKHPEFARELPRFVAKGACYPTKGRWNAHGREKARPHMVLFGGSGRLPPVEIWGSVNPVTAEVFIKDESQ